MSVQDKRAPKLSARLEAAVALAEQCAVGADIGADHGRLSAALIMRGIARRMLIADVSEKALQKARLCIGRLGLERQAVFAVADGLDALDAVPDEPVDTAFILGMGGETVSGILLRGRDRLRGATLILSAQTDLALLRQTLCDIGYRARREEVVLDGGRYYILMKCQPARPDEPVYTEEELWLGASLLKALPPLWQPVLVRRKRLLEQATAAMRDAALDKDAQRLEAFERELGYVTRALARYEGGSSGC